MCVGPIPCMPLENILIPCMPLVPHVIDTKKYTYMPLSGTQGMSIKSDGAGGWIRNFLQFLSEIWENTQRFMGGAVTVQYPVPVRPQ
jgi:hypothetical protein